MSILSKLDFRFQCSLRRYSYVSTESAMPREALRQQLDELYREISNCKMLAENFENHPCVTNQMMAKNPVANLRIPAKLFVLWSELKSIQVPAPTCIDLVRYNLLLLLLLYYNNCKTQLRVSLEDNTGFAVLPNAKKLEERLRKECSRTCKKYGGLRWDYSKERLGENEKCIIVYANEGTLQSPNYQPSHQPSTTDEHHFSDSVPNKAEG